MSTWAIIPIKPLTEAKLRLAPVLSPTQRRRLVLAMLEDVIATLRSARGIDRIAVVTADHDVEGLVRKLSSPGGTPKSLNDACTAAPRLPAHALPAVPCRKPRGHDASRSEPDRDPRGYPRPRSQDVDGLRAGPGSRLFAWEMSAHTPSAAEARVPAGKEHGEGCSQGFAPALGVIVEIRAAGLDTAVERGIAAARQAGADRVVIVPGDVPLTEASEIEHLLAAARDQNATIVPSADGDGTNALVLSPPHVMATSYGKGSAGRHQAMAKAAGLTVTSLNLQGLAADIDEPADLARLQGLDRYAFLAQGGGSASSGGLTRDMALVLPLTPAFSTRKAGMGDAPLTRDAALALADRDDLASLMAEAEELCLAGHGHLVTYSRKVFIPLTKLCRDVCHYCTFAHAPRGNAPAYLSRENVLAIARQGVAAGCTEALFTLGDKPEQRYAAARRALDHLGHATTLDYLEDMARAVLAETGLLPHLNAGVMSEVEIARLKHVSASQGIMLETTAERLSAKGGPHFGSPDKAPAVRLATLEAAGRAGVPFTTGLLIGIGETRTERIEALLAIRDSHARHGHIQEVIIQNFRAKPGTRMAHAAEPTLEDHAWTIAVARLILGPGMSIQAPPNLTQPDDLGFLIRAGINDWGGVSPVTPDHVNPEAPWPHLHDLEAATERAGRSLSPRLPIYPRYLGEPERWLAASLRTPVLRASDSFGLARGERWAAGSAAHSLPVGTIARVRDRDHGSNPSRHGNSGLSAPADRMGLASILTRAQEGQRLSEEETVALFAARGTDLTAVCRAADALRRAVVGDEVTYVVNRNINYTNVCTYGCKFCAFSKGRHSAGHRDKPYDVKPEEVGLRAREAWERGATEVCLQGGIAARYTGETYLAIVHAVKAAVPQMHVHAFSPLEVWHGAATLKLPLRDYLRRLKAAGLSTLPGTAAEILDDEVRAVLCPDKITTDQWLGVMRTAHEEGLGSTATIMYGHMEQPVHWARHLLRVRDLAAETGGFTELVPLAFVHMESPVYLKGSARKGPTFREAILMHAVGRLVLHPHVPHVQASWVKLGPDGAAHCLDAGADDLGGTLMNESITRAAGAAHGQEMTPIDLERLIRAAGRRPRQRTTAYGTPLAERLAASFADCEVRPMSMMAAE